MPHLILSSRTDLGHLPLALEGRVHRWRRAVLKTEACWRRFGDASMLVEGVVVEFSRPLHPVALVAARGDSAVIRLWPRVPVERTEAVQRWLCLIAAELQRLGAGAVETTNIAREIWEDLELEEQ